jgi:hypothetical protein
MRLRRNLSFQYTNIDTWLRFVFSRQATGETGRKSELTRRDSDTCLYTEVDVKCVSRHSTYRAVNTLRLGYKNQSVNVV